MCMNISNTKHFIGLLHTRTATHSNVAAFKAPSLVMSKHNANIVRPNSLSRIWHGYMLSRIWHEPRVG